VGYPTYIDVLKELIQCEAAEKCTVANCPHMDASVSHFVVQDDPMAVNSCSASCDVAGGVKGARCVGVKT